MACTLLASEPRVKVFLFGSRATGRAGSRSDIDLGIDLGHAIAPEVLASLRDAFDELPIMQKVDVVDWVSKKWREYFLAPHPRNRGAVSAES